MDSHEAREFGTKPWQDTASDWADARLRGETANTVRDILEVEIEVRRRRNYSTG